MGAGGAADFTAEAKFGADWILRMWDDPTRTLYYQVGIGGGNGKTVSDHDIWRLPAGRRHVRRQRPALPLHPEPAGLPGRRLRARSISPNLAGRDAAALALRYQVYPDERPGVREQVPRRRGQHIFDLANTNPGS